MDVTEMTTTVRHDIWFESRMQRGDPSAFKTMRVTVVRNESDQYGPVSSETVLKRRVRFEDAQATLASLEERFPGCTHNGHRSLDLKLAQHAAIKGA
jgi:hypothetical protein